MQVFRGCGFPVIACLIYLWRNPDQPFYIHHHVNLIGAPE